MSPAVKLFATPSDRSSAAPPYSGNCAAPRNTPGGPDPWGGCWPGAANTGPTGALTAWTGGCTITTAGAVIDSRVVNCDPFTINAQGVTIRNSHVNGRIDGSGANLLIDRSFIDATGNGNTWRALTTGEHSTVRRSEVIGGYSSGWCQTCRLEDSWFHGIEGDHSSAMRFDQHVVAIHNVFSCDAPNPDACSANTSGYADFQPTKDWLVQRNLYTAHEMWYCAYGGGTTAQAGPGGPVGPDYATDIRFIENVFQRGRYGTCGRAWAITDFDPNRSGNVWQGNRWDDGTLIPTPE
jgi:hypothetical protein